MAYRWPPVIRQAAERAATPAPSAGGGAAAMLVAFTTAAGSASGRRERHRQSWNRCRTPCSVPAPQCAALLLSEPALELAICMTCMQMPCECGARQPPLLLQPTPMQLLLMAPCQSPKRWMAQQLVLAWPCSSGPVPAGAAYLSTNACLSTSLPSHAGQPAIYGSAAPTGAGRMRAICRLLWCTTGMGACRGPLCLCTQNLQQ